MMDLRIKSALALMILVSGLCQLMAGSKAQPSQEALKEAIELREYQLSLAELRSLSKQINQELSDIAADDLEYFVATDKHSRRYLELQAQMKEITRLIRIKEGYEQE